MTQPLRDHEIAVEYPGGTDAALTFIGRIETPWPMRTDCPRRGQLDGPECTLIVDPPWDQALEGIDAFEMLDVLYWLHESRRDLLVQNPGHTDKPRGTFALRSPIRPNPIGLSRVQFVRRAGNRLVVRGLDCIDGTPLLDIKPQTCPAAAG